MKSNLFALFCALTLAAISQAQEPDNNAYAITSEVKGAFEWTEVKLINLDNGEVVSNIFQNNKKDYAVFDGKTSRQITLAAENDSTSANNQRPFAGLSAACAYDKKTNRLYYAPLYLNELRYLDLSAKIPSVYIFENESFSKAEDLEQEANQITRMVIASDGNGYALNNDGSHLVRFTVGNNFDATDLGSLYDASSNGDISISDPNTSWGGDMVADASGNLYVITAHNYVFRIDIPTKSATYVAEIKKLPIGFTTNGAVVQKDGSIVLSSANFLNAYFSLDPSSWEATEIPATGHVYNTSDLANNNFLFENKLQRPSGPEVAENISLYPNPVRTNSFRVNFTNPVAGNYNVQIVDIAGRFISDKSFAVSGRGQSAEVKVNASLARGMYMVKVMNHENKEVFLKKILLQ